MLEIGKLCSVSWGHVGSGTCLPSWALVPPAWCLQLFLFFQRRGNNFLAPAFWTGQPSRSQRRCAVFLGKELGLEFGRWLCQQRWPSSAGSVSLGTQESNPCFFRGLKSPPASSLRCAASLMEWTGVFLFKVNFVLNHELQLKLAKL